MILIDRQTDRQMDRQAQYKSYGDLGYYYIMYVQMKRWTDRQTSRQQKRSSNSDNKQTDRL